MRIRLKLLALLLFFAIVPLLLSTAISHVIFYRSGLHLAKVTERELTNQAHAALKKLVDSFQRLQERDRRMMETALTLQASLGFWSAADFSTPDASPPSGLFRPAAVPTRDDFTPGHLSSKPAGLPATHRMTNASAVATRGRPPGIKQPETSRH